MSLCELGTGSFGRVYKARQLSTGQEVAIKIPASSLGRDRGGGSERTERFRREMRLCAELSHPNIVRLVDSGETAEGLLYAVFQFVPGGDSEGVARCRGAQFDLLDAKSSPRGSGAEPIHRKSSWLGDTGRGKSDDIRPFPECDRRIVSPRVCG